MQKKDRLSKAAGVMAEVSASRAGIASAKKLTARQRQDRARRAVQVRWKKRKKKSS